MGGFGGGGGGGGGNTPYFWPKLTFSDVISAKNCYNSATSPLPSENSCSPSLTQHGLSPLPLSGKQRPAVPGV